MARQLAIAPMGVDGPCLIVIVSFALSSIDQTSSASTHQQEEVFGNARRHAKPAATSTKNEDGLARTIDEVSERLTSPFSTITSGSSSEWVIRGVGLLLALLVYGFGLGFIARVISVQGLAAPAARRRERQRAGVCRARWSLPPPLSL